MAVTLAEVIEVLDTAYPPHLAESWDSVGLVCGDPKAAVQQVLYTVDVTEAVVDEAIAWGADLIVAHHPLLLRGVDTVAADTAKGSVIHRLIKADCALFTAHTNADSADPGVSDALAAALGVIDTRPLDPIPAPAHDKWVVFVPTSDSATVRQALFDAGAGQIGDYSEASWHATGLGQFRPGPNAHPTLGIVGEVHTVTEDRIEVVAPKSERAHVLSALRHAHPYEEPAFDVFESAALPSCTGLGRIGRLPSPMTLAEFTDVVRGALPATSWGVRAAGDPEAAVSVIAMCGGAGDSFLSAVARTDADVYVTSDLRHHPVDEHLRAGGPAVIDTAHWASEFPWCEQARSIVDAKLGDTDGWSSRVTEVRTDPWRL
ncbi:Nif3-like dinuclear metal center hexameric protein [Rhodococcus sp. Leaf278]|uniref:Nif3-like dinuclear metal center hexameric protein n=1 Tax=Rhodococcus sp. Leaf278 TaxID=1736319 RepID=UPI00070F7084|nr:Nif3-like dinuclear metal center hexameric protein [Rhodococcus sp. Leaf278]KQU57265.1 Nif3-like dinuclear metal center hexameric protein [Rhodococcus sp. Leaf278]